MDMKLGRVKFERILGEFEKEMEVDYDHVSLTYMCEILKNKEV